MIKKYIQKLNKQIYLSSAGEFVFLFCQFCIYLPLVYSLNYSIEILFIPAAYMFILAAKRLIRKKNIEKIIARFEQVTAMGVFSLIIGTGIEKIITSPANFVTDNIFLLLSMITVISSGILSSLRTSPKFGETINWYLGEKIDSVFLNSTNYKIRHDYPFKAVPLDDDERDMLQSLIELNKKIQLYVILFFIILFCLYYILFFLFHNYKIFYFYGPFFTIGIIIIAILLGRTSNYKKDIQSGTKLLLYETVTDKFLRCTKQSNNTASSEYCSSYISIRNINMDVPCYIFDSLSPGDDLRIEMLPVSGILLNYSVTVNNEHPATKIAESSSFYVDIRDADEIIKLRLSEDDRGGCIFTIMFIVYLGLFISLIFSSSYSDRSDSSLKNITDFIILATLFFLYFSINIYVHRKNLLKKYLSQEK